MVSTLIENNPYEAEFHMNDYESKLKEIQAILQSMEGNENNEFASLITVTLTPSFHF